MLLFFQVGRSILMQFALDIAQIIFWVGTIVAAILTLWKGLTELRESRKLRTQELREKRAALALEFTNKFDEDETVQVILNVIDYGELPVKLREEEVKVNSNFFMSSLDPKSVEMAPDEYVFRSKYIVRLLNYFESFEHFIRAELMIEKDVFYRIEYFVSRLVKNKELAIKFYGYLSDVGFTYALDFLNRFPEWKNEIVPSAKAKYSFPEAKSPTGE